MYANGKKEGREQVAFMLHVLTPDCVFETIFEITPAFLQKRGIRGALIDIDGTASSHRMRLPSEELCAYVDSLQKAGIKVLFLSNNKAARVRAFSGPMGVRWVSRATKPLSRGFRMGAEQLGLPMHEIAVIGDQIFTDVLGGNRMGALTCQVQSIDRGEFWIGVRCRLEKSFIERGRQKMQEDEGHVH